MSKFSLKEKAILLGLVVLALYGLAAVLWFMKFYREWKKSIAAYEKSVVAYQRERKLISRKGELQAQYEEEQEKIPVLTGNELANAAWMGRLGTLAGDHNVAISRQNYGKEEQEGVLNKLEIDLEWTASLQCLVKFLYALETEDHAMFDVRSIGISAAGKNTGYLKGKMTVCCAYLREEGKDE